MELKPSQGWAYDQSPGGSDDQIVASFEGVDFTEGNFHETIIRDGQRLKRHRNGGGWVPFDQDEENPSAPFVDKTAYVGPWAVVFGNARVMQYARIEGVVRVYGHAKVGEYAELHDLARAYSGNAVIPARKRYGTAYVQDARH